MDEQNISEQDQLQQPMQYKKLSDLHRQVATQDPYFASMPLAKFSELLNEATESKVAQQGVEDSFVKRASTAVDRFVQPVSDFTGGIGKSVFGALSPSWAEPGQKLGESIPRSLAEMGAIMGGSAAALGSGGALPVGAGIAAWLAGAGSMGAKTYTETGSAKAGLTEAAVGGALPGFIGAGEKLGVAAGKKLLGNDVLSSPVKKYAARGIEEAGRQVGMLVNSEAAIQGTSLAQGGGMVGLTPEHVFALTAGQIPFTILDMGRAVMKPQMRNVPLTMDGKTTEVPLQGSHLETQQGQEVLQGALDKASVDKLQRNEIQEVKQAEVEKMQLDNDPDVNSALIDFVSTKEVDKMKQERAALTANKFVDKKVVSTGIFKPSALSEEYVNRLESQGIVRRLWDGQVEVIKQVGPTEQEIVANALAKNQDIVQQMQELHGKVNPVKIELNQDLTSLNHPTGEVGEMMNELHSPTSGVEGPQFSKTGDLPIVFGGTKEYTKLQYEREKGKGAVVEVDPSTNTYTQLASDLTTFFKQMKENGVTNLPRVEGTMEQKLAALEAYHEKLYQGLESAYEGHEFGLSIYDDKYPNLEEMQRAVKSGAVSVDEMYNRMTNTVNKRIAELYRATQRELASQETFAHMVSPMTKGGKPLYTQEEIRAAMQRMKDLDPKWLKTFVEATNDPVYSSSLEPQAKMMMKLVELANSPEKLKSSVEKFKKSQNYRDAKDVYSELSPEDLQQEAIKYALHRAPFGEKTAPDAGAIISSNEAKRRESMASNAQAHETFAGEGIDYNDPAEILARKEEAQSKKAEVAATQFKVRKYGEAQQALLGDLVPTDKDWKRVGFLYKDGTRAPHVDDPNPQRAAQTPKVLSLLLREFLDGKLDYEASRTRNQTTDFHFKYRGGLELLTAKIESEIGRKYSNTENFQSLTKFIREQFEPRLAALFDEQYKKAQMGGPEMLKLSKLNPETQAEIASLVRQTESRPGTLSTIIGIHTWFKSYFMSLGLDEPTVKTYSDIAAKIAAKVNGIDVEYRVGSLVGDDASGVHYRPNAASGMILLNPRMRGTKEMQVYMAFQTGAHELFHALVKTSKMNPNSEQGQLWGQAYKWAMDLQPRERNEIYQRWYDLQVPKEQRLEDVKSFRGQESEKDAEEFLADLASMGILGVVRPDTNLPFKDELLFSGPYEQQFAKAVYAPMFEIARSLEQHFNQYGDGKSFYGSKIANITKNIEQMLSTSKEVDSMLSEFAKVQKLDDYRSYAEQATIRGSFTADSVQELHRHLVGEKVGPQFSLMGETKEILKEAKNSIGLGHDPEVEKWFGRAPHFLENFFPSAQFAKLYPEVMPEFMMAVSFRGMADDMANQMVFPFGVKTLKSGMQKPDLTGLKALSKDPEAYKMAGKLALENALNATNLFTEEQMRAKMPGFSPARQQLVIDWMNAKAKSMEIAMKHVIASDLENVSLLTARMLMMQKPDMKYQQAIGAATLIKQSLVKEGATPEEIQVAAKAVQQLEVMLGKELLAKAQGSIEPLLKVIQDKAQKFGNQPGYVSEVRMGQYMVGWRTFKNETGSAGFDSKTEAVRFAEKKKDELGVDKVHAWDKYDEQNQWASVNPDTVEFYQSIEQPAFERAMHAMGIDPQDVKYLVGAEAQRHAVANKIGGYQALKKFAQGRELIDPVEGTLEYISNLSASLTKRYIRGRIDLALLDPSLKNNPELQTWARKHMQMTLYPEAKEWTFMKNSIFSYFLGFNFPSMILNGSQGVFTVIPQYIRDTGTIGGAYKTWGRGVAESVEALLNNGVYKDKEIQEVVMQARKDKHITMGFMDELRAEEDSLAPNFANLTKQDSALFKGVDLVKQPLWWYMKTARWMYSKAPEASSHATFVGAYRLYRETGAMIDGKLTKLSKQDAYAKAVETVYATEYGGGRAARPVGLFADAGQYQGAVGMMYSLGTYAWSTIAMMARLGIESISKATNLTPADKVAARKAFGTLLFTQTAAAGVIGLPMVGASLALLDQMFPELEAKKKFKQMFQTVINGDKDTGSIMSDIAMKGLPSQMTGIDLTSRMGLQSLFGLNPNNGFSLLNMIGPAGGMFGNLLSAGQKLQQGQLGDALKTAVPVPYKNLVRLYQDGSTYRDPVTHEPMMNMDTKTTVLNALGFTPKSVTDIRETKQLIRQGEVAQSSKEKTFYEGLAKMFMAGDATGVRQSLLDRQMKDPMFNAAAGARRVAQVIEAYNTPVDLAREGQSLTAHERQSLANQVQTLPKVSESDRLVRRFETERQLGVGGHRVSPTELRVAQVVDHLMQVNPTLSRQEAQVMAYRFMGRRGSVMQGGSPQMGPTLPAF